MQGKKKKPLKKSHQETKQKNRNKPDQGGKRLKCRELPNTNKGNQIGFKEMGEYPMLLIWKN